MPASGASIQIENVVASATIGQELDLPALAPALGTPEFDPDRFPGLVYDLEESAATALLFRSGNVVCTGATSVDDVQTAADIVFAELRELGLDVDASPAVEVQNIVSSGDLGQPLNLNAIAVGVGLETIEYEPEQFPGLVYRLAEPDVVALLFGSGKVVITGGTQPEDAAQALEEIEGRLADLGLLG